MQTKSDQSSPNTALEIKLNLDLKFKPYLSQKYQLVITVDNNSQACRNSRGDAISPCQVHNSVPTVKKISIADITNNNNSDSISTSPSSVESNTPVMCNNKQSNNSDPEMEVYCDGTSLYDEHNYFCQEQVITEFDALESIFNANLKCDSFDTFYRFGTSLSEENNKFNPEIKSENDKLECEMTHEFIPNANLDCGIKSDFTMVVDHADTCSYAEHNNFQPQEQVSGINTENKNIKCDVKPNTNENFIPNAAKRIKLEIENLECDIEPTKSWAGVSNLPDIKSDISSDVSNDQNMLEGHIIEGEILLPVVEIWPNTVYLMLVAEDKKTIE